MTLAPNGYDCERVLADFVKAGIDIDVLAAKLQDDGAKSFVKSSRAQRSPPTSQQELWFKRSTPGEGRA